MHKGDISTMICRKVINAYPNQVEAADAQLCPSLEVLRVRNGNREVLIRTSRLFMKLRVVGAPVKDRTQLFVGRGAGKRVGHWTGLKTNNKAHFQGPLDTVLYVNLVNTVHRMECVSSWAYRTYDLHHEISALRYIGTFHR